MTTGKHRCCGALEVLETRVRLADFMRRPEPYYSENGITIYHGDCREILPLIAPADLVITDPPYGISYRSRSLVRKHDRIAVAPRFPSI
jgi:hypothetical protein